MIPIQIQKRFANPGDLERNFMNYIDKANLVVSASKTIALQCLYDCKSVNNFQSVDFFTGAYDPLRPNIEGDFVRPSSEHFLIYGIMASYAEKTSDADSADGKFNWVKGFTTSQRFADLPANPLQNAQVSIEVNSVRYLKFVPTTEFDGELGTKMNGYMFLNTPILWPGQQSLRLTLQTNDQSILFPNVAGEQFVVRFDLFGIGLI